MKDNKDIELALYIIELKKEKLTRENNQKNYQDYKQKMDLLNQEKHEIYQENEEIIQKVLKQYLKEVKVNKE